MDLSKSKEVFNVDNRELRIGNLYKVIDVPNNTEIIGMLSNLTHEELTFLYPMDEIYRRL